MCHRFYLEKSVWLVVFIWNTIKAFKDYIRLHNAEIALMWGVITRGAFDCGNNAAR